MHPTLRDGAAYEWGTRHWILFGRREFCCSGDGVRTVCRDEEEVDGEGHPEGDEDVGDVEAGVDVGAYAGGHGEGGVEAGTVVGVLRGRRELGRGGWVRVEADAEGVDGQEEGQDAEGEGEACGPVVDAEEAHGAGGHPVHEGGLVEETDAVDGGSDEVVALEHLAGDLDVDGVDVVEKAGGEETAYLEDGPEGGDDRDRGGSPAADGRSAGGRDGEGGGHGEGFVVSSQFSVVSSQFSVVSEELCAGT